MKRFILFCDFLLLLALLTGCSSVADNGDVDNGPAEGDAMPGIMLDVTASNEAPEAGETVVLEILLSPQEDMQQAELTLTLPQETTVAGGPIVWQGELSQGKQESIRAEVAIGQWPLSEPIKITLSNNISTFWAYWPGEATPELPERQRGTPEAQIYDHSLEGAEPMPSVAVTLQVEPPDPAPGELTRFTARMTAESDFDKIEGLFELPAAFQLTEGSSLQWQGSLFRGVETRVEILATATQAAGGEARFRLDLWGGETIYGSHHFGPLEIVAPRYRPEGLAVEAGDSAPLFMDDLPPLPNANQARPDRLPLVDFTVVESEVTADEAAFTLFIFANSDISNAQFAIQPPASFALLEGDLQWQGDLQANDLLSLDLRFQRPADESGTLQINFTSDQGGVAPFVHPIISTSGSPAGGDEPEAPTAHNLSGRFLYDEDLTTARGMYWTRVEVYDSDGGLEGGDDFVCQATTDSNGYWSCTGSASDTFDNTVELYALARAYNSNIGAVKESNGTEYRFKTANHNMPESGGTYNFGSWWPGNQGGNPQDGAFHIHKMGSYANSTTRYLGGEIPPNSGQAHFVTFTWPDTDADSSSEYSSWNVRIEGPGSTDPDEWDESPVIHEYGHYLMDHFALLGSVNYCHPPSEPTPCGHSFNSHEDPVTAYIEGWPNYYQSAVKRYYGLGNAHMYIESSWSFNIENSWHSPTGTWDDAESTIAGILWDLNDSPNDDQNSDGVGDQINLNHEEIHDTFSNDPGGFGTPVTVHEFYNSFRNRYAFDNSLIRIYYEHGINKDSTIPSGSISINSGATYATSTSVTVNLSASDPTPGTGVTQLRLGNAGGTWGSWQSYSTSKSWTLPASNGTKTVYVQFRDGAGNSSASYFDSIILDTVRPSNPSSLWSTSHTTGVWSNDNTVSVSWSGASDSTSGVYGYGLTWSQSPSTTPAQTVITTGGSNTSGSLPDGNSSYFHLITRDYAGHWSASAVHLGPFYIDTVSPTGSISIDGGASYATSTAVTLNLSAHDSRSGVSQVRFSNGSVWSAWQSYAAGKSWTLAGGDGTKSVYAQFRDLAGNLSGSYSDTIVLDTTNPTGSISVENGATYATAAPVTLNLSASDGGSSVSQMRFSNDSANWSTWRAYASTGSWTLATGDGTKTVYVQFKDGAGNNSANYNDTIILDTVAPSNPGNLASTSHTPSQWSNDNTVDVSWSGAADSTSGVHGYGLGWSQSPSTTPGQAVDTTGNSDTSGPLPDGDSSYFHIITRDNAGNWSAAAAHLGPFYIDTADPTGSMNINSGATYATSSSVTLNLAASDSGSGVSQMRFSNDNASWSTWQAYAATTSWSLPGGDGSKTLYAQFRDRAGNSSTSYSDTIVLDTTVPTGSISIENGASFSISTAVTLNLAASDSGSGVAQMRFSADNASWSAWQAYVATESWSLSSANGTKTVYVQYRDGAGLSSATYADTILLDTITPTGSISVENGAPYATSASVRLQLSAADSGSGVAQMRFSNNSTTWSAWQDYATGKTWALTGGDGNKRVFVQFSDHAGNVSSAIRDSIHLDTTPPSSQASSPATSASASFEVSWQSQDSLSGVDSCDLQYRKGMAGVWTHWLNDWTEPSAQFGPATNVLVEGDETYYFRVRCTDHAGNQEAYTSAPTGDTHTYVQPLQRLFLPIIVRG